jgi:hypothetical protein
LKIIGAGVFSGRDDITEMKIPESVTEIGEFAFADCKNLVSVEFNDSLTKIGNSAFR